MNEQSNLVHRSRGMEVTNPDPPGTVVLGPGADRAGQSNGEVRVRFDRKYPDRTLSVEDAQALLMALREAQPLVFGRYLRRALGLEKADR
jgi:hypothetical protein